jgi:hypothetical protein
MSVALTGTVLHAAVLSLMLSCPAASHTVPVQVRDLTSPQLRFKVDVNARENHMSGACLVQAAGEFCIVVVEGSPKTLRR